jgi:hypothetical protein
MLFIHIVFLLFALFRAYLPSLLCKLYYSSVRNGLSISNEASIVRNHKFIYLFSSSNFDKMQKTNIKVIFCLGL